MKQSTDGAVNVHVVSRRPGSSTVGLGGGLGSQTVAENASASGACGGGGSLNGSASSSAASSSSCGASGNAGASTQSCVIPGTDGASIGGQRVSLTVMPNGDINLKRGDDLTGKSVRPHIYC